MRQPYLRFHLKKKKKKEAQMATWMPAAALKSKKICPVQYQSERQEGGKKKKEREHKTEIKTGPNTIVATYSSSFFLLLIPDNPELKFTLESVTLCCVTADSRSMKTGCHLSSRDEVAV